VFNRTLEKANKFVNENPVDGLQLAESVAALCDSLSSPRRILLMVKAGEAVDAAIDQLLPLMDAGDILIDGGNSLYSDTEARLTRCASVGMHYLGLGVSGGELGARFGPSLMPGGVETAWPVVKPMLQSIAAKVDGAPCCQWVGKGGAGHFVKMVHNGIEYGDMQIIAEAYHLLKNVGGLDAPALSSIFDQWHQGVLDSYLIEITRDIFKVMDDDGSPLVDKILDSAGQKGTGKWTAINSLEAGVPLTLIGEAVFARYLSAMTDDRTNASKRLPGPSPVEANFDKTAVSALTDAVRDALYASKIVSYAQGFMLLAHASREHGWDINFGDIALMWRGGCIIRSRFLGNIKAAYEKNPSLDNLLLDDFFQEALAECQNGWRKAVSVAITHGIPVPAFSAALAFYDGFRSATLPANLIQAQRDFFGAHTYERLDCGRGDFFHTNWEEALGER
jgi:6-phosphogluconate dehydrogenase